MPLLCYDCYLCRWHKYSITSKEFSKYRLFKEIIWVRQKKKNWDDDLSRRIKFCLKLQIRHLTNFFFIKGYIMKVLDCFIRKNQTSYTFWENKVIRWTNIHVKLKKNYGELYVPELQYLSKIGALNFMLIIHVLIYFLSKKKSLDIFYLVVRLTRYN